ncbi:MAG: phosphate ABC transporter permease subunit PstC [Planctomycetes bacterium]|nr:phosphate ABC transporter permease subunit PstC [Planctomycetota bacterium]
MPEPPGQLSASTVQPPSAGAWTSLRSFLKRTSAGDVLFQRICQASALSVLVVVVLLWVILFHQSWLAIKTLSWPFLIRNDWNPAEGHERLGALAFIYGSVVTSVLALALAVPLGVGTAAFLAEIAPGWLRRGGSFLVELLAAIPSVVYGFWGINFLAPGADLHLGGFSIHFPGVQNVFNWVGGPDTGGKGLLAAGLILAIMIVPYVAAVSYDVCQAVPRSQREGALALGATRWQMIWRVVLPYARPGIVGGCFLALGRAIGETMAVTMLIGNSPVIEGLPFGRGISIPSVIALQLPGTQSHLQESALIELGLILFVVTILLNVLARLLLWRMGRGAGGKKRWARKVEQEATQRNLPPPSREGIGSARQRRWARGVNHFMTGILGLCLVATLVPLFLILGFITYRGVGSLNWAFFVELPRPMGETGGGMANAIAGSLTMVGLATLAAVPLGILAAIFLGEYRRNRLAPVVRFVGELLNGVPSIVVGTFVYALIHVFIQAGLLSPRHQFSGWAGALALAIMMIPIIMRASEEALKLVPQSLRNASHALGAHHWQTVLRVTVPAGLSAIITGVFLGIARIAGETAPLLMTAFGNFDWANSPGDKTAALPVYIYKYSMSGYPPWERQAWAAALVLLAFVMFLNIGIRFLTGRRSVLASRAD